MYSNRLRDGNKTAHPGKRAEEVTRIRRPAAEVEAERNAKRAEKERKLTAQTSGKKKAALLELQAKKKEHSSLTETGTLTSKLLIPRQTRQRPTGQSDTFGKVAENQVIENLGLGMIDNDKVSTVAVEDDMSGSEFLLENSNDQGDVVNSEDEYEIELENDEPDTLLNHKANEKKPKKGLMARQEIREMAVTLNGEEEQGVKAKRKAVEDTLTDPGSSIKRSKQTKPSGVLRGWEQAGIYHPTPLRSRSTSSGVSDGLILDDSVKPGGVPSDDEELERSSLTNAKSLSAYRSRITMVKTEDSTQTNLPGASRRLRISNKSGQITSRPTHNNLPASTQTKFKTHVMTMAYDYIGARDAWEQLSQSEVTELWNCVNTDEPICPKGEEGDADLFKVVFRLVKRDISSLWTHGFAETALKALAMEFDLRHLVTTEDRALFVKTMIGDVENLRAKDRPFLWASAYKDGWDGVEKSGLFLGPLVARTLAHHLDLVTTLPSDLYEFNLHPRGALILSVQAVHRALIYTQSGKTTYPEDADSSFSSKNWGDIVTTNVDTNTTSLKARASLWKKRVETLTEKHWSAILEAAHSFRKGKRVEGKQELLKDIAIDAGDEDDDLLVDPEFD